MLTTLLITLLFVLLAFLLLAIKILFVKGGKFPNTHIEGNKALKSKGICCAKSMDRETRNSKGLLDMIDE